jgi:hypothetical protein
MRTTTETSPTEALSTVTCSLASTPDESTWSSPRTEVQRSYATDHTFYFIHTPSGGVRGTKATDSYALTQSSHTGLMQHASKYGCRIEPTSARGKHANSVTERSVGAIASETNLAMSAPTPPVPSKFLDPCFEYACISIIIERLVPHPTISSLVCMYT